MVLTSAGAWSIGVVCDGLPDAPCAERAARLAAETGAETLAGRLRMGAWPEEALADAAVQAGRAVTALAGDSPDTSGGPPHAGTAADAAAAASDPHEPAPACTFLAGIAGPAGLWSGWIGDSRGYWLPDKGPAIQLTDDAGADGGTPARLGADAGEQVPRIRSHRPRVPGRLLLCTDGLWRYLDSADDLSAVVAGAARGAGCLEEARSLITYALGAGGEDNVTALLLPLR